MHDALASQFPDLAVPAPGAELLGLVYFQLRETCLTHPALIVVIGVRSSSVGLLQRWLLSVFEQQSS